MARILVTSGPTREAIDPVRFLTNASTGRMGAAVARAAAERGHQVDLVTGPVSVPPPKTANVVEVVTADQMLAAALVLYPHCDAVVGAAAVSDFRPAQILKTKQTRARPKWTLELVPTTDILEQLGRLKRSQIHAGFALETGATEEALERARRKLERKHLDWIVLNTAASIGADAEHFWVIPRHGKEIFLGKRTKEELACLLLEKMFG